MPTNPATANQLPTILRLPEVRRITGFSTSQLYRLIAANKFPRQVPLGPKSVGFVSSEVHAWIFAKIAERDAGVKP